MKSKRSRLAVAGVGALALALTIGLTSGSVAQAKKKHKSGGVATLTNNANTPIPDASATTEGTLVSTINLGGKKFKKTKIRDVNVTVQTTGDQNDAAGDLFVRLTAPNGATTPLFFGLSGQSIGPLTLDDETPNVLGGTPPAPNSETVVAPYNGTAQPNSLAGVFSGTLSVMDSGPATGTYRLFIYDTTAGANSVLNSWTLNVTAGKPFKT
jgi:subtilisin-like proprotein convertase family protein